MREGSIDAMLALPQGRMGAYSLLAPIGTGGMGAVYLARKIGIDEPDRYAIKVMLPHLSGDERFASLFLHEARIATRVRHPNVCRVIDYGSERGTYYIAMELLQGRTLAASLSRLCAAPPAEAHEVRRVLMSILADVAAGLEHAHELADDAGRPLQIVHRDVCPPNLFVTDDGIAKILDFGIALYADRSFQTTTGEMKGHLAYVAPEMLAGMRAERSADVWSLAVIVWEALASQRLFRRDSEAATISAVLHDPVPRLSASMPEIPPEVDAAIARGLERDRSRRTTSATRLVRELFDAFGLERASTDEIARSLSRWLASDTEESDAGLATAAYGNELETVVQSRAVESGTLERGTLAGDRSAVPEASMSVPDLDARTEPDADLRRRARGWVAAGAVAVLGLSTVAYVVAADGGNDAPTTSNTAAIPAPLPVPAESHAAAEPTASDPAPPTSLETIEHDLVEAATATDLPVARRRVRARSGELVVPAGGEWSEVWVDGERVGFSPLVRELSEGRHQVSLRRDGAVIDQRTISVRAGQRTLVRAPVASR